MTDLIIVCLTTDSEGTPTIGCLAKWSTDEGYHWVAEMDTALIVPTVSDGEVAIKISLDFCADDPDDIKIVSAHYLHSLPAIGRESQWYDQLIGYTVCD